ncbi:hypothetical protein BD560DRAFT_393881 [Blakeslea trispora]|nr:hypothetical protein BD560DRAFT_393881 [Blakeslea trispora]
MTAQLPGKKLRDLRRSIQQVLRKPIQSPRTISTVQLYRSVVIHLHPNPDVLHKSDLVNTFITILLKQAALVRLHRDTVSLQPSIDFLTSLSNSLISLADLQAKLAFLLGIACFLQPSDLHHTSFSFVSISDANSLLSFEVHDPKEKHNRRRIIKSFTVKAHANSRVCHVTTFLAFQSRRPSCSTPTLLVNSVRPSDPLSIRTLYSWIRKLIRLSSDEPRLTGPTIWYS